MKFDISLDKRGIFVSKDFLRNLYGMLWITASVFILLMPVRIFTQPAPTKSEQSIKKLQVRFGLSDQHVDQLRPLIRQQAVDLGKIFTDFSELSDSSYFPFWINADMWLELRESRKQADNSSPNLTQNQRRALLAAYTMLEGEMLSNLLDEQMTALAEDLELTEAQSQNIYEILAGCLEQDRQLIFNIMERPNSIREKLNVVFTETERKIERILFPEQLKTYKRNKHGEARLVAAHYPLTGAAHVTGVAYVLQTPTPTPAPSPTPESQTKKGVGLWTVVPATGDTPQTIDLKKSSPSPDTDGKVKKEKRGEFVIAPIPLINPTLGNGLILGAGYLFKLDKNDTVSPPSMVGGAVFGTSNGSRGFGAAGQFHLKNDRYRLLVAGGKAKINMSFFGTGADAGNAGVSIPLSLDGNVFLAEGLIRLRGKWYLGARYHILKMRASLDREDSEGQSGGGPVIPPLDIELRTAAIGPHLKYDGANDPFYPTKGSIFDLKIGFFGQAVGGNRAYQSYDVSYNKYISRNEKQVFAARFAGCFIRGRAPFYDLCSVGLRGYEAGQYIDRNMLSGQLEFRQTLPKRFGFVIFGGLGEVADTFNDFSFNKMLPAGGAGLRFRLTKQSRINLRFDYAWGKGSSGLYIGVSEAF